MTVSLDGWQGGWGPITRRSFPREEFPRDDAQWYVSARCDSRAETYPCASSRGNASRGKDQRVIGPRPARRHRLTCDAKNSAVGRVEFQDSQR